MPATPGIDPTAPLTPVPRPPPTVRARPAALGLRRLSADRECLNRPVSTRLSTIAKAMTGSSRRGRVRNSVPFRSGAFAVTKGIMPGQLVGRKPAAPTSDNPYLIKLDAQRSQKFHSVDFSPPDPRPEGLASQLGEQ